MGRPAGYDWKYEHALIMKLSEYQDLLHELTYNYEVHKLARYAYDLAKELNRYYEKHRIIDEPEPIRSARVYLISLVEHVMTDALDILGIPVPEKM